MAISAFAGEHIFTNPALHLFQGLALCIFLIGHISPLSLFLPETLFLCIFLLYIKFIIS